MVYRTMISMQIYTNLYTCYTNKNVNVQKCVTYIYSFVTTRDNRTIRKATYVMRNYIMCVMCTYMSTRTYFVWLLSLVSLVAPEHKHVKVGVGVHTYVCNVYMFAYMIACGYTKS
jgi:hypothetical protein